MTSISDLLKPIVSLNMSNKKLPKIVMTEW